MDNKRQRKISERIKKILLTCEITNNENGKREKRKNKSDKRERERRQNEDNRVKRDIIIRGKLRNKGDEMKKK